MYLHIGSVARAECQEGVMAYSANRLPSRFPVGTKFVIESHRGKEGPVYSRFLEFPDGTFFPLPSRKAPSSPHRSAAHAQKRAVKRSRH
jgi:hypothetical protein